MRLTSWWMDYCVWFVQISRFISQWNPPGLVQMIWSHTRNNSARQTCHTWVCDKMSQVNAPEHTWIFLLFILFSLMCLHKYRQFERLHKDRSNGWMGEGFIKNESEPEQTNKPGQMKSLHGCLGCCITCDTVTGDLRLDSFKRKYTKGSDFLVTFDLRGWKPGLWLAHNSLCTSSFYVSVYLLTKHFMHWWLSDCVALMSVAHTRWFPDGGSRVLSVGMCWYRESSVGWCRPVLATISTGVLVNVISLVSTLGLVMLRFFSLRRPHHTSISWHNKLQWTCIHLLIEMKQICANVLRWTKLTNANLANGKLSSHCQSKNCKRRKVFIELWDSSQWCKYVFCLSSEPPETVTDCELKVESFLFTLHLNSSTEMRDVQSWQQNDGGQ